MKILLFPLLFTATLHAQDPPASLTREQALKVARSFDGRELGDFWFEHGDKQGPFHHAGRVVLSRGAHISYQVAGKNDIDAQTGLYVDDDVWETHLDFFTSEEGNGWVVCHNFKPEVEPTAPSRPKDERSSTQKALGPAAAFAIEHGDLEFLKTLVDKGLDVNEALDFEEGTTPLYAAVWERNLEISRYLLKQGADPRQRARFDQRPIDLAIEWELKEIRSLLAAKEGKERMIAETPAGLLEEIFVGLDSDEPTFIEWNGEDPPAELLIWLRQTLPNARPASRMETIEKRPLGAHSWYRDKTDQSFGRLLQIRLLDKTGPWKFRFRNSVGPSMAGHGWEATFKPRFGYWIRSDSSSWDE